MTRAPLLAACLASLWACRAPLERADTYELEISGLAQLSRADLVEAARDDLDAFALGGFAKSSVDDAAYAMERFCRDQGFPLATVDYGLEPAGAKPKVRFEVEEGPRTEIDAVAFEGRRAVSEEDLLGFFPERHTGLFGTAPAWYVESQVASAPDRIAALYESRGYLDVRVEAPRTTFDDSRTRARVAIRIDEGRRYVLGEVTFAGELVLSEATLRKRAAHEAGEVFHPRLPHEIRARLSDLYGTKGYPDARIEARETRDADTGRVDLAFQIDPGARVRIAEVRIQGNDTTRGSFVRSRVQLEKGDVYDRSKARESAADLYQAGAFRRVDIELEGEGEERPLVVTVDEQPSLELYVEPGWGSYEKARVTLGAREKNLLGTGRTLTAEGTLAVLAQSGKVALIDPWFLGSEYTSDLSLFGGRREEPSFTRLEIGTSFALSRQWTPPFRTVLSYELRRSDSTDVDPTAAGLEEDVRISAFTLTPTYDTRDSFLYPHSGSLSRLGVELAAQAIGSELDFVRVGATRADFFPLRERTVLATSLRTGVIVPIGATDTIPIQERYFNGGENTVRSFREDELGPTDATGNAVGGETYTVLSAELRHQLAGRFSAAVFYDTGNVVPDASDYFDFADFRAGVGAGLRYELPIGPVRLDAAVNPNPRDDEDDWVVHFSLGMSF